MDKTIESLLPVILIFSGMGMLFTLDILMRKKYGSIKVKKTLCFLVTIYLVYIIVKITLLGRESVFPRRAWLIPFYSYYKYLSGWQTFLFKQNIQNILMFMPFGYFASILFDGQTKQWSKRVIVGSSLALSLFIEITQYIRAIGVLEIDDILHNTLGTAIGCVVYETVCCLQLRKSENGRRRIILKEREAFVRNIKGFGLIIGVYFGVTALAYANHLYHVHVLWT